MLHLRIRRTAGVLALGAVLVMSGCTTLGPDFQEPDVAWLNNWQPDLYGQAGASQLQAGMELAFWWHLFDDPVLNSLIETARQQNPSLRIAGLRILESRAQLGIAGSALYPQQQQASGAASYVNTESSGGVIDNDQSLTSYQAGVGVGWELDFWGKFKRGIESADAAFLASIANQRDVQVLLTAQVADLYFAYRTTLARISIARSNADLQKRSLDITKRLFEGGQKSELDLQQAKTQYLSTLSSIPGLEISLTQIRNSLGALMARAPNDLPELADVDDKVPTISPPVIDDVPARLLMRRPDIRTAAWQIAAQSAQIGIAEADLYPSVSLLGSLAWSGTSRSASPNTLSLAIGPSFTWNIFDHGRIRNNVRVQDVRLQESIESFQNAVLQAAQEIDSAAINVVKTHELESILADSVKAARRSLDLANKLYVEGYADFQRVLDSQRAVFTQSANELVNRGNRISAVINLYKALGGGWMDTPIDEIIPEKTRDTMKSRSDWGNLLNAPLPPERAGAATGTGASP